MIRKRVIGKPSVTKPLNTKLSLRLNRTPPEDTITIIEEDVQICEEGTYLCEKDYHQLLWHDWSLAEPNASQLVWDIPNQTDFYHYHYVLLNRDSDKALYGVGCSEGAYIWDVEWYYQGDVTPSSFPPGFRMRYYIWGPTCVVRTRRGSIAPGKFVFGLTMGTTVVQNVAELIVP